MKPRASIRLCSVGGVPVYLNITLPLGLALFSQFTFRPLLWLAFLSVVLVHEAGHSVILHWYRLPVLHVLVHAFGGECGTVDWMTPWQRSVVAWGGVLAQALLFIIVDLSSKLGLWPATPAATDLYTSLSATNLLTIGFNLLPFRPLDGREAWRLPWLAIRRAQHAWLAWRLERARAARAKATRERLH